MVDLEPTQLDGDCTLYTPPISYWRKSTAEEPRRKPTPDREVMQFGKCRGWCLHEVITGDAPYARWLMVQDWFEAKYPKHYQYFAECLVSEDDAQGPSAA